MKLSTFTDNWMGNQCVKFYIISFYSSWKISKILYGILFLARPVHPAPFPCAKQSPKSRRKEQWDIVYAYLNQFGRKLAEIEENSDMQDFRLLRSTGAEVWRRAAQCVRSPTPARLRSPLAARLHPVCQLRPEGRRALAVWRPGPVRIVVVIVSGGSGWHQPIHVPRLILSRLRPPGQLRSAERWVSTDIYCVRGRAATLVRDELPAVPYSIALRRTVRAAVPQSQPPLGTVPRGRVFWKFVPTPVWYQPIKFHRNPSTAFRFALFSKIVSIAE